MATEKVFVGEFSLVEKLWLSKAIAMQSKSLERSLSNELPGSEIYDLRKREIGALAVLTAKVDSLKEK